MAKATTKGGEAKKLALVNGCTLPSKLRLPLSTEAAQISLFLIASYTSLSIYPEFPMHVIHP